MKRIFSTVLACALCVPLMAAPAHAAADPVVRVGLAYGSSALAAPQLQNVDGAGYEIGKMNGTTFVPQTRVSCDQLTIKPDGGGLAVIDTQTGKVVYDTEDESLAISPNGELTWFNKYKYYGDFRYTRDGGSVSVINYVDLEDYIKGVVPYEMSASWPREALKAQAVCVRSYADGLMGKHKSQGFDLCATTHCEVYRGATVQPRIRRGGGGNPGRIPLGGWEKGSRLLLLFRRRRDRGCQCVGRRLQLSGRRTRPV